MDTSALIGIAGLVMQIVLIIFLMGAWKGQREHSDTDLAKRVTSLEAKVEKAIEHGQRIEGLEKEIRELTRELDENRRQLAKAHDRLQTVFVRMAIIRTKLAISEPHETDEDP